MTEQEIKKIIDDNSTYWTYQINFKVKDWNTNVEIFGTKFINIEVFLIDCTLGKWSMEIIDYPESDSDCADFVISGKRIEPDVIQDFLRIFNAYYETYCNSKNGYIKDRYKTIDLW